MTRNSGAALRGSSSSSSTIAIAAEQTSAGATPLPMTGYKLDLLRALVHDLLERLVA